MYVLIVEVPVYQPRYQVTPANLHIPLDCFTVCMLHANWVVLCLTKCTTCCKMLSILPTCQFQISFLIWLTCFEWALGYAAKYFIQCNSLVNYNTMLNHVIIMHIIMVYFAPTSRRSWLYNMWHIWSYRICYFVWYYNEIVIAKHGWGTFLMFQSCRHACKEG